MFRRSRPTSAPPGAGFIYDEAAKQLREQLASITDLDTKIGIAVGALGVVVAAFVAAKLPSVVTAILGSLLGVALVQIVRAFIFDDRYQGPANAEGLIRYAGEYPPEIKWAALPTLLEALAFNQPKISRKGRLLNQVVLTLALVGAVILVGKVFGLT